MNRRIVQTRYANHEREVLQTVIVFESGVNKEGAKQELSTEKKHDVLIYRDGFYAYKD